MSEDNEMARRAAAHADQAVVAAAKLKVGSWESVQALATLSIAESLLSQRQLDEPRL